MRLCPPIVLASIGLALLCDVTSAWSGPRVEPVWNKHGVSAISIDGHISAPSFLVGNTAAAQNPDGTTPAWKLAAWKEEIAYAAKSGVRIFGICLNGEEMKAQGTPTALSNETRSMVDYVLKVYPEALILPRIKMQAGGSWPPVTEMNMTGATSLGPSYYSSLTAEWAQVSAPRIGDFLQLLDRAYPTKIAGVHLTQLVAGENTYNWQPGDFGWPDYSDGMVQDFCKALPGQCTAGHAPTPWERNAPVNGSNIFVGNASAAYNLFLSRQVQRGISTNAAAAKRAMEGKGFVMAFYGYLNELGDRRVAGGGDLALHALLSDPNLDAVASPEKYAVMYRGTVGQVTGRPKEEGLGGGPGGPSMSMGPFDAPRVHRKLWIVEDDTRTSFVQPGDRGFTRGAQCHTTACDRQMAKRNLFTAALHGSGKYYFDLVLDGWYGRPNRTQASIPLSLSLAPLCVLN